MEKVFSSRAALLPVVLAVGILTACASSPKPAPFLAASSASIEAAQASGAPELAPVPLNDARTKLQQAEALARNGKDENAVRLAQQADADAQLARAQANAERSRRSAAELDSSLQALQDELSRRQAPGISQQPQPSRQPR